MRVNARMYRVKTVLAVAAAAAAVAPATAGAQVAQDPTLAPPPKPILYKLDHTPIVMLAGDGGGLPFLGSKDAYDAGDWEDHLRAYVNDGVYAGQLEQIGEQAQRFLRSFKRRDGRWFGPRIHGRGHFRSESARVATHRHRLGKKLAIVLDIDETTLSNYSAIDADGFTFGPKSRAEAQDQVGEQIAPTKELFDLAKARGIAVFFVTGRAESVRTPTEQNLAREGFMGYQQLFLKPAGFTGSTLEYKSGARAQIEDQGYKIVENVGDQFSDLAGGHAIRGFKYANPFYFLP